MPQYVVPEGYTFGRGDRPSEQVHGGGIVELTETEGAAMVARGHLLPVVGDGEVARADVTTMTISDALAVVDSGVLTPQQALDQENSRSGGPRVTLVDALQDRGAE